MKKLTSILLALFMTANLSIASDRDDRPIHELHSMLVFNFLKYIEWPDDAKGGNFIIAVVGDQDVYQSLTGLYSARKIAGMPVSIQNYSSVSEVKSAHMVFLSASKSREFDELKTKFDGRPTLLITDSGNLGKKGSNINFKQVGGKLKFEINEAAFESANLKIANQLLAMGITI